MKVSKVRDRENPGSPAKQVLVLSDETPPRYFVVSTVVAFDTGKMETLVFASDAAGDIESFTSLAGGIGMTRAQAIADLEAGRGGDHALQWAEELGGVLPAMLSTLSGVASGARGETLGSEPGEADLEWDTL